MRPIRSLTAIATALLLSPATHATTLFSDYMNRATFDAATNGWTVQTYNKANSKGTYGRIPGAVDTNTAFRYGVQEYSTTNIVETNTVVGTSAAPLTFAPPTAGHYLEFDAAIKLNWSTANVPGLVFGMSAYATTAAGKEDAANIEFVTKQINAVNTNGVSYDRLDLTSFNDYGTAANKWYQQVESGVNSTDNYHTYAIRLYTTEVDYLVDGNIFARNTSVIPTGTNLNFVLVAWAPDSSWPSAEATLPGPTGFWYMDVSWVTVTSGTGTPPPAGMMAPAAAVPEPATLTAALLAAAGLVQSRPRRISWTA